MKIGVLLDKVWDCQKSQSSYLKKLKKKLKKVDKQMSAMGRGPNGSKTHRSKIGCSSNKHANMDFIKKSSLWSSDSSNSEGEHHEPVESLRQPI